MLISGLSNSGFCSTPKQREKKDDRAHFNFSSNVNGVSVTTLDFSSGDTKLYLKKMSQYCGTVTSPSRY
jgi:hypothetical protein